MQMNCSVGLIISASRRSQLRCALLAAERSALRSNAYFAERNIARSRVVGKVNFRAPFCLKNLLEPTGTLNRSPAKLQLQLMHIS